MYGALGFPRRQPCNNIVRTRSHFWGALGFYIGAHGLARAHAHGLKMFHSSECSGLFLLLEANESAICKININLM